MVPSNQDEQDERATPGRTRKQHGGEARRLSNPRPRLAVFNNPVQRLTSCVQKGCQALATIIE